MNFEQIIVTVPALMMAVIFHEIAHGAAAYMMGDKTAKEAGRLTINPIPHIDLLGTIILPGVLMLVGSPILFGWAKPVPIDPRRFKNLRMGMFIVSLAGAMANITMAILGAIVFRFLESTIASDINPLFFASVVDPLLWFSRELVIINLVLAFFNLLPIPPLDGSRVVMSFFSVKYWQEFYKFEPYGFLILTLLIFTGVIGRIIYPFIAIAYKILLGGFGI
ncbi:site-2 protease family protein [Hydrogenobaculum acidophilum]